MGGGIREGLRAWGVAGRDDGGFRTGLGAGGRQGFQAGLGGRQGLRVGSGWAWEVQRADGGLRVGLGPWGPYRGPGTALRGRGRALDGRGPTGVFERPEEPTGALGRPGGPTRG